MIAKREDFNIFEIFKLCFDLKGNGFIDKDCLERAFDDLEVNYVSSSSIDLVIWRFSSNEHNGLTYSEFSSMMLSSDKRYYDLVINRMPINQARVTKDEFLSGGSVLENLRS